MSLGKRCAIIFLTALNLINIVAGAVVDYKLLSGSRVRQILPHNLELSSVRTMLVDFLAVALIITLISIVTTYLATDIPYTPIEIIQNFAVIFFLPSLAIFGVSIYGAVTTPLNADRPWIIVAMIIYLIFNAINISCVLTVKEDE